MAEQTARPAWGEAWRDRAFGLEALLQQAVDALVCVNEMATRENGCQGDCRIPCESCAAYAVLAAAAEAGIKPKEPK